jgi:hypothetical protein
MLLVVNDPVRDSENMPFEPRIIRDVCQRYKSVVRVRPCLIQPCGQSLVIHTGAIRHMPYKNTPGRLQARGRP